MRKLNEAGGEVERISYSERWFSEEDKQVFIIVEISEFSQLQDKLTLEVINDGDELVYLDFTFSSSFSANSNLRRLIKEFDNMRI